MASESPIIYKLVQKSEWALSTTKAIDTEHAIQDVPLKLSNKSCQNANLYHLLERRIYNDTEPNP